MELANASFLLQSDAPQLRPKWTLSALLLLGAWGLGVSLNSAIQAGHAFFHCDMPYPELENNKLCTLARGTLVTAWISTASVSFPSAVRRALLNLPPSHSRTPSTHTTNASPFSCFSSEDLPDS